MKSLLEKTIAIIGGGPAGLIAAEILSTKGFSVHIFDAKPAVLRKFLVAGQGGLNLTKAESFEVFLSRYSSSAPSLKKHLSNFGPPELITWVNELGFSTFTGSSHKVFPEKMDAVQLRRAWIKRLQQQGVQFHLSNRWIGWNEKNELLFETRQGIHSFKASATILAMGGASWPKTGSDGSWLKILRQEGIKIEPFKPANCGFNVNWSDYFRQKYAGSPLKSVALCFFSEDGKELRQKGEFVISDYGVEGNLIYKFSALIREKINKNGQAIIYVDLKPDWDQQKLATRLSKPRGSRSLSSHIYKTIGLHDVKTGLLREFLPKSVIENPVTLAQAIKSVPIPLISSRPVEEAISTAGGVSFDELSDVLMLIKKPGVFCAGEMLDWEAPTGGYLLTACFSTGKAAAQGAVHWLEQNQK